MGFYSSARFVDGADLTWRPGCEATQEGCNMDEVLGFGLIWMFRNAPDCHVSIS